MKGYILAVKKGQWVIKDDNNKTIDNYNLVIAYKPLDAVGYCPFVSQATKKPWFACSVSLLENFMRENGISNIDELLYKPIEVGFKQGKSTLSSIQLCDSI